MHHKDLSRDRASLDRLLDEMPSSAVKMQIAERKNPLAHAWKTTLGNVEESSCECADIILACVHRQPEAAFNGLLRISVALATKHTVHIVAVIVK
jgi:hypothetical protein